MDTLEKTLKEYTEKLIYVSSRIQKVDSGNLFIKEQEYKKLLVQREELCIFIVRLVDIAKEILLNV